MSYNSKYTGAQVEEYLDRIANGELGGITEESDPIFTASPAAGITTEQIAEWNEKQDAITDLATIRSGAEKGATAVQPASLAKVATSGNYDDLSNKPSIPSAITESTVSGWGFTKNQGTITEVKMNGTSKGTSDIVDLGNVITSHQDISGKKDKPNVQNVTTASVSLVLTPNTIYNCTSALTDITISSFNTTSEGYEEYMFLFKSGDSMTLSLPSNVYWANGEKPDIDADTEYELSISKRLVDGTNIFKAILVPFKTIE